ncbi:UDP-2,3-diacylglucosamine diphosphatase [Dongshaea marina]|uniref:UDP-2,3-diacylglucosamine diphosphatase n=1 Tax=Dongshaea marina TaxID=2047966 RepID=UPI000D3E7A72|nr:UDP-2,3-diacylglucosamine diphosphatase [Dongshaea marina]
MSRVLLISDLHLSEERPGITGKLEQFLQEQTPEADALYVLGDLFDSWIGDDDRSSFHLKIAGLFKAVSDSGIPLYLMAGNRDFLLGKRYAKRAGMQLISDPHLARFDDRPVLLTHGDLLCSDDEGYQKYRRTVHKPWLQLLFLSLPLWVRRKIAKKIRASSEAENQEKQSGLMDVSPHTVLDYLERYQVCTLIHGHTHRAAVHPLKLGEEKAQRIVLGDWSDTCGSYLEYQHDEFTLHSC